MFHIYHKVAPLPVCDGQVPHKIRLSAHCWWQVCTAEGAPNLEQALATAVTVYQEVRTCPQEGFLLVHKQATFLGLESSMNLLHHVTEGLLGLRLHVPAMLDLGKARNVFGLIQ